MSRKYTEKSQLNLLFIWRYTITSKILGHFERSLRKKGHFDNKSVPKIVNRKRLLRKASISQNRSLQKLAISEIGQLLKQVTYISIGPKIGHFEKRVSSKSITSKISRIGRGSFRKFGHLQKKVSAKIGHFENRNFEKGSLRNELVRKCFELLETADLIFEARKDPIIIVQNILTHNFANIYF